MNAWRISKSLYMTSNAVAGLMIGSAYILIYSCALIASDSLADDRLVYESIRDIPIGTVFLSPAERASLDRRRRNPVTAEVVSGGGDTEAPVSGKRQAPAGYITNSSGVSRRWVDGDFVRDGVDGNSTMRFPGDIEIIRHRSNRDAGEDEGESDAVEKSGGLENNIDSGEPEVVDSELEIVGTEVAASD